MVGPNRKIINAAECTSNDPIHPGEKKIRFELINFMIFLHCSSLQHSIP